MNRSSSSDFPAELSQSQDDLSEDASQDTIFNSFTDKNICGEGASCIVYRTRWKGLRVAVKRLKAECRTVPTYVASYRKEYQLGQQLKHDALPVYRDMHEDINEVYIVMDYVDGISLSEFIDSDAGRKYFSDVENVKRFLIQLLDVVIYLHRSGVIHCDIKPANIMLRHSDRGVMLIDLDKCYSDSLDRTHGGTAYICAPLDNGEKPTAAKDFTAIGNLIDYIAERVPKFPAKHFKRFRDACRSKDTTDERLSQTLQYRSKSYLWAIVIAVLCIACGAFYLIRSSVDSEPSQSSQQTLPAENSDTVRIIERVPSEQSAIQAPTQSKSKSQFKVVVDFDNRMSAFIQKATAAMAALRKGNATNREIRDMVFQMAESYTTKYQFILAAYKSENLDMSGIDVEIAVARASERSKATKLLQQFTQAASDTLEQRRTHSHLSD